MRSRLVESDPEIMTAKRWTSTIAARAAALTLWLIAPAFFASHAIAGPLEDAAAAYDRGDYATARRLYLPLAEQGIAQVPPVV